MELRELVPDWVNPQTSTLTSRSIEFLKQVDTLTIEKPVKKTLTKDEIAEQVLGPNYLAHIETYRELFPKGKLPTGSPSRLSLIELKNRFIDFFKVFPQYNWEQILQATKRYVEDFAQRDYNFMRNSGYFIYREERETRNRMYELANQIEMLGDDSTAGASEYHSVRRV